MASATARLVHPCSMLVSKNQRRPMQLIVHTHNKKPHLAVALHSVDVSKDDKPLDTTTTTKQEADPAAAADDDLSAPLPGELDGGDAPKLDPRRFEEQFAVLNTGVSECRSCGYLYDQAAGDPSYPVPRGLPFDKLPDDWRCPTCGAAQSFFDSKSVEIAGFAQNQQFGLGGNSLTGGQKTLLIYGSLLVGFAFFLSGYFLQ